MTPTVIYGMTIVPRTLKRRVYDVVALTDIGEVLAGRFTSRERAGRLATGWPTLSWSYYDSTDRYQSQRAAKDEPLLSWGMDPGPLAIHFFVDETVSGPIDIF